MITKEQILASEWPMRLDPEFDGSCPCFLIEGDGFTVQGHCWRTHVDGCKCRHSGIHVTGLPRDEALAIAEHIRSHNGWSSHTDWAFRVA